MDDQPRLRQFEAAAKAADSDYDRARVGYIGSVAGQGETRVDVVFAEDLGNAFGDAETRHDEQSSSLFFRPFFYVRNEIDDAAVITHRRLRLPLDFESCCGNRKHKYRTACFTLASDLDLRLFGVELEIEIRFRRCAAECAQFDALALFD